MTTAHSPKRVLKAQADLIAKTLKDAERGRKIDARFAAKLEAARSKPSINIGVAMDDKIITIDIPWRTIRESTTAELSAYMVGLMRETRTAD